MSSQATATLSAHKGAQTCSRDFLSTLAIPVRTTSFTPIQHGKFVDTLEMVLNNNNMYVTAESYAVSQDGAKLFGTLVLNHQTKEDFSFAIGLRTANDKSMAVQLTSGLRVFVCDNMSMSGHVITWEKHTGGLDFVQELMSGVDRAIRMFDVMDSRILELKGEEITDIQAKAIMLDSVIKGVIPQRMIPTLYEEYFAETPRHEEFMDKTLWSLHNAFTQCFKELRPNIALESAIALGDMFGL